MRRLVEWARLLCPGLLSQRSARLLRRSLTVRMRRGTLLVTSRAGSTVGRVRTTIRVDDDLYRRAEAAAARSGRSVGEFIEDAVRAALAAAPRPAATRSLPRFGGSGVHPGVDLADPRSLLDLPDP